MAFAMIPPTVSSAASDRSAAASSAKPPMLYISRIKSLSGSPRSGFVSSACTDANVRGSGISLFIFALLQFLECLLPAAIPPQIQIDQPRNDDFRPLRPYPVFFVIGDHKVIDDPHDLLDVIDGLRVY